MGKSADFRADMAGLGKYSTGGYDRIAVQLHGFEHLRKWTLGWPPAQKVPQSVQNRVSGRPAHDS